MKQKESRGNLKRTGSSWRMMEFIDTHAHLCDERFDADRGAIIEKAAAAGVLKIFEIADEPRQWEAVIALCRAYPGRVRCALGLHPYFAGTLTEGLIAELEDAALASEVAAIGEIGLDYIKSDIGRDSQLEAFRRLLRAAVASEKPAVIHCRGAYEDMGAVIEEVFPAAPTNFRYWGVIHCFSGSAKDALSLARRGFAIGVDGPVTYPKNDQLREAVKLVGLPGLVLETDSPYLPPQSARGQRNDPAAIPEIALGVARTLGLSLEEVAEGTTRNALDLYRC